jgi:HAD superfamily hydrolase (TIGR01509 family)
MGKAKLKVKGILFDLDGTILDSRAAYVEAAKTAFAAIGQEPPETAVALEIPRRLEQRQPISDIVRGNTQSFLEMYLRTFYAIAASKTKPIPNVALALEKLSRKAKLALITMRYVPKETVVAELKQFDLAKHFMYVVTALDTHEPKPSPEALVKAVEAMDVEMCTCVIVGDSVSDIQAGKAAGAKTVAVLSGLFSREELSRTKPDLIVRDVTELSKFME